MRNIRFHVEYSLSDLSAMAQEKPQWRIQTDAMGSKKPMKTAHINSIQFINFVLGKNNNQGHDTFFAEMITLFVQSRVETSCDASCRGDRLFAY